MRDVRTNHLTIRTPEGVSFSLLLAGPVTRFFAWAIDFACILVIFSALTTFLGFAELLLPSLGGALLMVLYFAISIGYGMILEWYWRGQTLGKRLLRLRVMDVQGLRLRFSQVAIRNLVRFVDMLPGLYLVGGIACLLSRYSQRLGDHAANTIVIRAAPAVTYDSEAIAAGKFNSFRDYPHLEARLRQKTSPEKAALALQALMRREELDPEARVTLYNQYAAHFRALVPFPEEATFGLTDEQYLRNAVDSLFRVR